MNRYLLIMALIIVSIISPGERITYAQYEVPVCPTYINQRNLGPGEVYTIQSMDGYNILTGQMSWGIQSGSTALPIWPTKMLIAGSNAELSNVSGEVKTFLYCYDPYATQTPTPTPTPNCEVHYSHLVTRVGGQNATRMSITDWPSTFPTYNAINTGNGWINSTGNEFVSWISEPALSSVWRIVTGTLYFSYRSWPIDSTGYVYDELIIDSAWHNVYDGTWMLANYEDQPFSIELCATIPTTPTVTNTPIRPEPNLSPTQTRTSLSTRTPAPPLPTRTPTRSPYPTAVSQCVQMRLPPGGQTIAQIDAGAFVRILNGIAIIVGSDANYSVGTSGMIWSESSGTYTVTAVSVSDGGSQLVMEVCQVGHNWTPTMTTTPTAPALPCAIAGSIGVPVAPGTATLSLVIGMRFVVVGASIWINVGDTAYEIRMGNYQWDLDTGDYTAYSLTDPATVWICTSTAGATVTSTGAPTWTPGTGASICVAISTALPAQTGQIPSLDLTIPTLAPLPSMTPASVSITATIVISPAETMIALVIRPARTITAWSSQTFGSDGFSRAQSDAAPIVTGMARAFGWLAVIQAIGPLAWLLPALVITILVRSTKPVVSLIKYIKQIIPFQ